MVNGLDLGIVDYLVEAIQHSLKHPHLL